MNQTTNKETDHKLYIFALKILWDFSLSIAIPVVALSLLGEYLDETRGTRPWFLISSFGLSALISAKIVYSKAKKYGNEYQRLVSDNIHGDKDKEIKQL